MIIEIIITIMLLAILFFLIWNAIKFIDKKQLKKLKEAYREEDDKSRKGNLTSFKGEGIDFYTGRTEQATERNAEYTAEQLLQDAIDSIDTASIKGDSEPIKPNKRNLPRRRMRKKIEFSEI